MPDPLGVAEELAPTEEDSRHGPAGAAVGVEVAEDGPAGVDHLAEEVPVAPGSEKSSVLSLSLNRHFDLPRIEKTVEKLEGLTEAEVVPVILGRTRAWWEVYVRFTFLFGVLASALVYEKLDWQSTGSFQNFWTSFDLFHLIIFLGISFVFGLVLIGKRPEWHRFFFSALSLEKSLNSRARLIFRDFGGESLKSGKAVFLVISWFEHSALVYAGETVYSKIPQSEWDSLLQELVKDFRNKDYQQGLTRALERMGLELQKTFPLQESAKANQLKNTLRILD